MSQPGKQNLRCTGIIINKHLFANHVFEMCRSLVNFIIFFRQRGLIRLCTFCTNWGHWGTFAHVQVGENSSFLQNTIL